MVAVRATTAFDTDSPLSALVDRLADAAGGSGPTGGETGDESGADGDEMPGGEDFGMGGGVSAKPVCALEITDGGTRFVRVGSRKGLLAVGALAFLAGVVLGRR